MKPVVLVGHSHACPIHGKGVVETGSPNYQIEGKAVARQGDRTDHGGYLEEGDIGWQLE